jgi:very-short-patch-repair endonuclease
MPEPIHNLIHLLNYRKSLRKEGTSAEAFLWSCLRSKQLLGRKFRRQHSIENMIVDFYCAKEQLVIELDGEGHRTVSGQEDDRIRDQRLEQLGFTVLRYENNEVFKQLESVLHDIMQHFREPVNRP